MLSSLLLFRLNENVFFLFLIFFVYLPILIISRQDTADDMKRAEDLSKVPEDAKFRPVALHVHGDYTMVN